MSSLRARALSLVLATVVCGAIAAPAVAATNVVIEVQIQARIFRKDPDANALKRVHPRTVRQIRALIPRYRRLRTRFRTAATAVSRARARTDAQRLGRRRWVRGARTFATGLRRLNAGLEQILHHHAARARRTIVAADRALRSGDKLIASGNHTLGLR